MSTLRQEGAWFLCAYIIDFYVNAMSCFALFLRILKSQNEKVGWVLKRKNPICLLKESLYDASKGWEEELALLLNLLFSSCGKYLDMDILEQKKTFIECLRNYTTGHQLKCTTLFLYNEEQREYTNVKSNIFLAYYRHKAYFKSYNESFRFLLLYSTVLFYKLKLSANKTVRFKSIPHQSSFQNVFLFYLDSL